MKTYNDYITAYRAAKGDPAKQAALQYRELTTLTLNIGLNTNTGETLTSNNVLQHLTDTGFFVHASRTEQSSTEQTLIVRIDSVPTLVIYEASTALNQDCISVSPDNGKTGELIGPNAAAWGEFNPKYFLPL